MCKNVGKLDKIIRILIAIAALAAYLMGYVEGTVGYIVAAIGIIMAATSLMNFCPLYKILGINSCCEKCPMTKDSEEEKTEEDKK